MAQNPFQLLQSLRLIQGHHQRIRTLMEKLASLSDEELLQIPFIKSFLNEIKSDVSFYKSEIEKYNKLIKSAEKLYNNEINVNEFLANLLSKDLIKYLLNSSSYKLIKSAEEMNASKGDDGYKQLKSEPSLFLTVSLLTLPLLYLNSRR